MPEIVLLSKFEIDLFDNYPYASSVEDFVFYRLSSCGVLERPFNKYKTICSGGRYGKPCIMYKVCSKMFKDEGSPFIPLDIKWNRVDKQYKEKKQNGKRKTEVKNTKI